MGSNNDSNNNIKMKLVGNTQESVEESSGTHTS